MIACTAQRPDAPTSGRSTLRGRGDGVPWVVSTGLPQRTVEYLARLPEGLRSFPETVVQAAVVHLWITGHDIDALAMVVPPALHPLIRGEVEPTMWIPEVHATVIYLGLREAFFESDDAFVRDAKARNLEIVKSIFAAGAPAMVSPARIGTASQEAFGMHHRGLRVQTDMSHQPWTWSLFFPEHVVPELLARCYATALVAGLEAMGKQAIYVELVDHQPDRFDLALLFEH